jgi:hypothetical protein
MHPWRLVAPWYRWERQYRAQGLRARVTRPVIQKYLGTAFAKEFLAEPQRSVKYTGDDVVFETRLAPFRDLFAYEGEGRPRRLRLRLRRLSSQIMVPTQLRKLFLPTQGRAYLVVCELRCDTPGFPKVPAPHAREAVCEMGFVIRRPYLSFPKDAEPGLRTLAARIRALETQAAQLARALQRPPRIVPKAVLARWRAVREPARLARLAATLSALAEARRALDAWSEAVGPARLSRGWIPSEHEKIGAWDVVEEQPQGVVAESVFPLFPLAPDPKDEWHTGHRRALYFGVIPTGSDDTDDTGLPRFDDRTSYEIRCFVRRHRPACKKTSRPNDCQGEVVWSEPTEPFRFASHFDLTGSSQRPITVQLPDLNALGAQAADLPRPGMLSSSRLIVPNPESELGVPFPPAIFPIPGIPFTPTFMSVKFAVPLVTVVAMFLLNLFLPIVISIFGLYSLLPLRVWLPALPNGELLKQIGPEDLAKMRERYTPELVDSLVAQFDKPDEPVKLTERVEYEERVDYEFPPDPPPLRRLLVSASTTASLQTEAAQ